MSELEQLACEPHRIMVFEADGTRDASCLGINTVLGDESMEDATDSQCARSVDWARARATDGLSRWEGDLELRCFSRAHKGQFEKRTEEIMIYACVQNCWITLDSVRSSILKA